MAQSTIIFTNSFTDGTKRNLSIGPYTTSSISPSAIKTAVKDLNANPATIANIYLSDNGAPFAEVSQVKISTADKTIII